MESKSEPTYEVKIYLAGDINLIKNACRKYCFEIGLCVTVKELVFIYTGGEEYGVEIGLLNYPRFPDTKHNILQKALNLAAICRKEAHQHSYLVVAPERTLYDSIKPTQP
jgi:hypothetical protein